MFIEVQRQIDGVKQLVNLDTISVITKHPSGFTTIVFDDDNSLGVLDSYDVIKGKIEAFNQCI